MSSRRPAITKITEYIAFYLNRPCEVGCFLYGAITSGITTAFIYCILSAQAMDR